MTRTAADLDVFMSMINQNCAAKLAELDREAFVAKCLPPDDAVAKTNGVHHGRCRGAGDTAEPARRAR
jgi:hypothetical protein